MVRLRISNIHEIQIIIRYICYRMREDRRENLLQGCYTFSNLRWLSSDNWFNLKLTVVEIRFCFSHLSRLRILKTKLARITCHDLQSLADLSLASASNCYFLFLHVSSSGKSLIFLFVFVCLKQRPTESLSEEFVNMFQCTSTSDFLRVGICTHQTGIDTWQSLVVHMVHHFTASGFPL